MAKIDSGLNMQCKVKVVAYNDNGIKDEREETINVNLIEALQEIFKGEGETK